MQSNPASDIILEIESNLEFLWRQALLHIFVTFILKNTTADFCIELVCNFLLKKLKYWQIMQLLIINKTFLKELYMSHYIISLIINLLN